MLAIVTTIYGKHDLVELTLQHYKQLQVKYPILLIAVGSEGKSSRLLAKKNGWHYIEYPNSPLTNKVNVGFLRARDMEATAVCAVGSDDLMSENLLIHYLNRITPGTQYLLGLKDLFIYSVDNDETLHWLGYGKKFEWVTVGAFRIASKWVLDKLKWKPWRFENNHNLDWQYSNHLSCYNIREVQVRMFQSGAAVDIKYKNNLTQYKRLIGHGIFADSQNLFEQIPIMKEVKALRKFFNFAGDKQYKVTLARNSSIGREGEIRIMSGGMAGRLARKGYINETGIEIKSDSWYSPR